MSSPAAASVPSDPPVAQLITPLREINSASAGGNAGGAIGPLQRGLMRTGSHTSQQGKPLRRPCCFLTCVAPHSLAAPY